MLNGVGNNPTPKTVHRLKLHTYSDNDDEEDGDEDGDEHEDEDEDEDDDDDGECSVPLTLHRVCSPVRGQRRIEGQTAIDERRYRVVTSIYSDRFQSVACITPLIQTAHNWCERHTAESSCICFL